jgi:hypothetical protein
MPVDESKFYFTPCDPWESLDPVQRVLRALRIVVGLVLCLFFLAVVGSASFFLYAYAYPDPALSTTVLIIIIVVSLLQAAAIARMLIWRPERKFPLPRLDENRREEGPDPPPPDDAPRPAPLMPFSPKVLSATAPLGEQ